METENNREERWYAYLLGDTDAVESQKVEAEMRAHPEEAAEARHAFEQLHAWSAEPVEYEPFDLSSVPHKDAVQIQSEFGIKRRKRWAWLRPNPLIAAAVLLLALTQVQFSISAGGNTFAWGNNPVAESPVQNDVEMVSRLETLEKAATEIESAIEVLGVRDSVMAERFEQDTTQLARNQQLESQARLRDMHRMMLWTEYPNENEDEWLQQAVLPE
jgi:hypothetical protein